MGLYDKLVAGRWLDGGGAVCNVRHPDFGATGDGYTDDRNALAAADAAPGPNVLPAGVYRVGSDLVLSSATRLEHGAMLRPDTGVTITFNAAIDTGLYHVFDLGAGGQVRIASDAADRVPIEWFGGSRDPAVDSSQAWESWTRTLLRSNATGYLARGTYHIPNAPESNLSDGGTLVIIGDGAEVVGTPAKTRLFNVPLDTTVESIRIVGITFRDMHRGINMQSSAVVDRLILRDVHFHNVRVPVFALRSLSSFTRPVIDYVELREVSAREGWCGFYLHGLVRRAVIDGLTACDLDASDAGPTSQPHTRGLALGYNWTPRFPHRDLDEMGDYSVSRLRLENLYDGRGGSQECQGARLQGRKILVNDVRGRNLDNASGNDCELLYLKGAEVMVSHVHGVNACRRQGLVVIKRVEGSPGDGHHFIVRDIQHFETRGVEAAALWIQAADVLVDGVMSQGGCGRTEGIMDSGVISTHHGHYDSITIKNVTIEDNRGRAGIMAQHTGRAFVLENIEFVTMDGSGLPGDRSLSPVLVANGRSDGDGLEAFFHMVRCRRIEPMGSETSALVRVSNVARGHESRITRLELTDCVAESTHHGLVVDAGLRSLRAVELYNNDFSAVTGAAVSMDMPADAGLAARDNTGYLERKSTLNPGVIAAHQAVVLGPILGIHGTRPGDHVEVYPPYDLKGCIATGYTETDDTIRIVVFNPTGSEVVLGAGDWRVNVVKRISG